VKTVTATPRRGRKTPAAKTTKPPAEAMMVAQWIGSRKNSKLAPRRLSGWPPALSPPSSSSGAARLRPSGYADTWRTAGPRRRAWAAARVHIEHIKAGRLRPLAVATATRSEVLPTVPTVADFVPGFEASATTGTGAPAGTPLDIINKLNSEINAGVSDPRMRGGGNVGSFAH
jgi:hypothetical protein